MKVEGENDISYTDDDDLVTQFIDWTSDAIVELRQIVENLAKLTPRDDDSINRLYDLVHNIKGMGASFNFDLMTAVGTELCAYLKARDSSELVSKRVLESHIRTFEVVLQHKITGPGGEQGDALMLRLKAIIQEEST